MLFAKNILAVAITTAVFASSAQAAFTNPGSWTRGDANSVYAEWDVFNATTDDSPDIGSANLASGIVTGTGVTKTSSGNLYGSFDVASYTISITGNGSGPVVGDNATVYLQIGKGLGSTNLDLTSVLLNGIAGITSNSASDATYLFSWNISSVENFVFTFNALETHFSFGTVSVDIASTPSQVPVPAAAWLMGSGLVGLASVARRRKA